MTEGARLGVAIDQIEFARAYTNELFQDVIDDEWFQIPEGCVSHLAWQMGHLAMAEYGLTMLRLRGKEPTDSAFITNDFMRAFKKGSTPKADPSLYPSVTDIRGTFDAVHAQALTELAKWSEKDLRDQLPAPYAVESTKLGSVFFCPCHEMLHAGQIGLIRRMLGKEPLR